MQQVISRTSLLDNPSRATHGLTDPESWKKKDWSWWKPGDTVAWSEVYPDDMNFLLELDSSIYRASDMYCINLQCTCKTVIIAFHRMLDAGGMREVGSVDCDLATWRPVSLDPVGDGTETVRPL